MRYLFLVICAAFLISFGSALTVDVPSSVPENVSWGFSVELDQTDAWEKTSVRIDGKGLLDVYSNGTITLDPYNGQFVLKAFVYDNDPKSTSGLVVFVSHFGLINGEHTISADSENLSDSAKVLAFSPLDDSFRQGLEDSVGQMRQSIQNQDADIRVFSKKVQSVDQNLTAIQKGIGELENDISSIESEIAKKAQLAEQQQKTEKEVSLQEAAKSKPNNDQGIASGLVGLGPSVLLGFAIIIVICIAAIVLYFVKGKLAESSIYGKKDEYDLPLKNDETAMADALAEGGKWAKK